ncbi:MAG: molecular chaperone DnaJ [Methylococcales bacterium]
MIRIILILGLIFLVSVALRWFGRASSAAVKKALKRLLLAFAVIGLLYLTATGRLGWLLPLIGAVAAMLARSLPYFLRLAPLLQRLWMQYRAKRPRSGEDNISTVETEFVRMKLDHDLGEISGEILKGRFAGRALNELDLRNLLQLREEVMGHDQDSLLLIESYLDRIYPDEWRKGHSSREQQKRSFDPDDMTREEALEILGLAANSLPGDIIAAHRRLIQKIHPDRGGSDYLAAKINRAREVLLG